MFDNKDYSTLTLEELQAEAKTIKNHQLFSAGLVGFLIGIMIYGAVKNGFGFLYIVIPLLLIGGIAKNSQSLKVKSKEIEELIGEKS